MSPTAKPLLAFTMKQIPTKLHQFLSSTCSFRNFVQTDTDRQCRKQYLLAAGVHVTHVIMPKQNNTNPKQRLQKTARLCKTKPVKTKATSRCFTSGEETEWAYCTTCAFKAAKYKICQILAWVSEWVSSFLTAHQHIEGHFSAIPWC